MNNTKTYNKSLKQIERWENELKKYNIEELLKTQDNESWSLGQVYIHLIRGTINYHFKQVEICLNSAENQSKKKNFKGFMTYNILHSFPPIKIKVPPSDFYTPKQPKSVEEIITGLHLVKEQLKNILTSLQTNNKRGKTPHPAFSYLNAEEWYKLVEMHFTHHLKQKNRIDTFLGMVKK